MGTTTTRKLQPNSKISSDLQSQDSFVQPLLSHFSTLPKFVKRLNWKSKYYLLIRLVFCFPEEPDVLYKSRLDVFVVHKLTEDVKLFPQELVCEVDLEKKMRSRVILYPSTEDRTG